MLRSVNRTLPRLAAPHSGLLPVVAAQSTLRWASTSSSDVGQGAVSADQQLAPGPYRRVGNIIVAHVVDHPYKYGWEIHRALRNLKLDYRGESRVLPDTPQVREWLFRVRHIVSVDMMSLDEAKDMLGVPRGVTFRELQAALPHNSGAGVQRDFDTEQGFVDLAETRRMKLRDVMQRDALELRLLRKKKEALASGGAASAQE
jgi:ribosomal protein L30/L7E